MKLAIKHLIATAGSAMILSACATQQWAERQYGAQSAPAPNSVQKTGGYVQPEYGDSGAVIRQSSQTSIYPTAIPTTPDKTPEPAQAYSAPNDYPLILGGEYELEGRKYLPEDNKLYDEVGYASIYPSALSGGKTANGEMFNAAGYTAAHKTLPMPSYVEVTRLDTGQTILVRVNDRGPMSSARLIDLTPAAAQQLGIKSTADFGVRVRRVNPAESEKAALRAGRGAQPRPLTSQSLLAILRENLSTVPKPIIRTEATSAVAPSSYEPMGRPVAERTVRSPSDSQFIIEENGLSTGGSKPQPVTRKQIQPLYSQPPSYSGAVPSAPAAAAPVILRNGYSVQLMTLSNREKAADLARKLGGYLVPAADGRLWHIRLGPYKTAAEAEKLRQKYYRLGYTGAAIINP